MSMKTTQAIFPDSGHNIRIHYIACSAGDEQAGLDTSLFTINVPSEIPVSTFILDKKRPKYHFMYDIILHPELY